MRNLGSRVCMGNILVQRSFGKESANICGKTPCVLLCACLELIHRYAHDIQKLAGDHFVESIKIRYIKPNGSLDKSSFSSSDLFSLGVLSAYVFFVLLIN